jgi:MarR family transcriptional regulator, organic hydroperoxide resistance regulator
VTGQYTLGQTEQAVAERLAGLDVDHEAMAAVSNLYRAAGVVRNHVERTVLAEHDLTWTAWVVLWVVWVWREIETRHAASEAGISKSTLTGVVGTLERRGLITRRTHPGDGRRVLLTLTPKAAALMTDTFPAFNQVETMAVEPLTEEETRVLTRALRKIVTHLEQPGGDPQPSATPASA